MRTITLEEAFAKATKGPITSIPFPIPEWEDDPMGVYQFEPARGQLQRGYDTAPFCQDDTSELDAVHETNQTNAALLAHCFNHFQEVLNALGNIDFSQLPADRKSYLKNLIAKANQVKMP